MANDSLANGTIRLKGRWTKRVLEDFLPVLEMWRFYGGLWNPVLPDPYFAGPDRGIYRLRALVLFQHVERL